MLKTTLLLAVSQTAKAQYSPPSPLPTPSRAGATSGISPSPFSVQMPQTPPPTSFEPALPPTATQQYVPMALPPSSGGFNPNTRSQPEIMNPYNAPTSTTNQQTAPTRSEVILFNPKPELKTVLVVKTSEGEFKITLRADVSPQNVANFIDLALGQKEFVDVRTGKKVKRPFYTGLNCHRVVKGVLIQCGCPFGNGAGGPGHRVRDERSTAMKFDRPGIVAMALARTPNKDGIGYEPNSAGSQFFISLAPLPDFNGQFSIIGQVTSGMETIRKIAETPTGPTDRPIKRVIIFSIDPDLPPLTPMVPVADPMAPAAPVTTPSTAPTVPGEEMDPFAAPPPEP